MMVQSEVGFLKAYETKFRQKPTSALIKGYPRYNSDFRALARDEFKKRGVPNSKLPYTSRKGAVHKGGMFSFLKEEVGKWK